MANYSGGYIIIDLTDKAIYSEAGATVKGAYEKLEGNPGKPVMLKNVLTAANATPMTVFATQTIVTNSDIECYIGSAYGISVTDADLVTLTTIE